jgi:hypothetical protein
VLPSTSLQGIHQLCQMHPDFITFGSTADEWERRACPEWLYSNSPVRAALQPAQCDTAVRVSSTVVL